eukprot:296901-Prymnesium_polylepis.1
MFRRIVGDESAGPAWVTPQPQQENFEEARGWSYLSGDEERVVDVGTMSDEEIRRLLPSANAGGAGAADAEEAPQVSELGYALWAENR